jgi:hypothetical protein
MIMAFAALQKIKEGFAVPTPLEQHARQRVKKDGNRIKVSFFSKLLKNEPVKAKKERVSSYEFSCN